MWKSAGVDVTAIAPRIRHMEQVHRRAEAKPSVSVTVNLTAPQWQEPSTVTGATPCQRARLHWCARF